MTSERDTDDVEAAGDAACWAHLLCAECGRVLEDGERAAAPEDEPRCHECRDAVH